MNTEKLISLINQPSLLADTRIEDLERIVEAYPYFTIGHLLLTKKMQLMQHLMLKKAIKKTAVITPNRKKVYELLYQKEIQTSIIESQIEVVAPIPAIEPETLVTETSKTVDEDQKSSFKTSVEIPSSIDKSSAFAQPINLKDLGKQASDDMDILEQQIIGQTIEHVLTQEIENTYKPTTKSKSKKGQKPTKVTGKQKFSDWLEILDQSRLKTFGSENVEESNERTESELINSFLNKNANIIHPTNDSVEFTPSNLARLSIVDDENFVTETLANVYETQGNFQKALNAFNKLMLKYPEKKTYFAARIKKIEKDLK